MFKQLAILLAFAMPVFASNCFAEDSSTNAQTSAPQVAWIDVRSWVEYQADSIDGDTRIGHKEIVDGVTELYPDKNTPIRLYCRSGGRAGAATLSLNEAGYTNVQNVGSIHQARTLRDIQVVN